MNELEYLEELDKAALDGPWSLIANRRQICEIVRQKLGIAGKP